MSVTNFNTRNDTFRKLMGNGLVYRVPRFQRDYSWTEDEWEDLWTDILGTMGEAGEPAHYMGYLVLQSSDDRVFDVIDGQQRLTTISLIVLAVLKNLRRLVDAGKDSDRNGLRLDQIRQTYIGYLDPVTLVPRSKLTLNRNNDKYFQNYLVPLEKLPQRGFKASEHLLRRAFEWFDRRLQSWLAEQPGDGEEGESLARFVECLSDRLFFTVISVTDELNAFKVFETLNARGVRLSATDLLKNHLFSVLDRAGAHDEELRSLEDRWEGVVGRLGSEGFPDFLRVHWNSRREFVRQTDLFKTIRKKVADRKAVFELLRELDEDLDTYVALTKPEGSDWSPAVRDSVGHLRLFNVRQPFALLLAARRRFDDGDFERLLRGCEIISFRYNVIGGLSPAEQERVYHQAVAGIVDGCLSSVRDVIARLAPVYPSDESFKMAFTEKSIRMSQSRNRRIVRYVLSEIERHLGGSDLDFESDTFSVEHVFPQGADQGWDAFPSEDRDDLANRLGNMTLLESSRNRDVGNATYEMKQPVFAASIYAMTRKLAEENRVWRPDRVEARQSWMAKQATAIWRIPELG